MKLNRIFIISALLAAASFSGAAQSSVRVSQTDFQGPRTMEDQTRDAAVRDYLQSWQAMRDAFEQNRPALLDRDFVGLAKDELASTIQQQAQLGIHARYRDHSHDLQLLFYSPEGLSIELADTVEYEVEVFDQNHSQTVQHVHVRYLVVLTPSESRWLVRLFQAEA
jgi:hypothetical protein